MDASDVQGSRIRLGRAVLYVHQQDAEIHNNLIRAQLGALLAAGAAMDFAVRLKGHRESLTPDLAYRYAAFAGVSRPELVSMILPALKSADVVSYALHEQEVTVIEEYVGITGSVVEQTARVLDAMKPTVTELAVLHSVEVASWAPLTERQHLEQLSKRGFTDQSASEGLRLALATGINRRVNSPELREQVVFNANVWGSKAISIAAFLRGLPSAERDALLGICEGALNRPGLALSGVAGDPRILISARKVGLIQAAKVKSSQSGAEQTYVFSPLLEDDDDQLVTTEALHQRKLFVAHILFGTEKAQQGRGRIMHPTTLVNALLRNKVVGPASNIATDYHMLEAAGVVRVETLPGGRGLLHLVKEDIVEGGLAWLSKTEGPAGDAAPLLAPLRTPGSFVTPEQDRAALPDEAAANEVAVAAVLELRKEAAHAARRDAL